MESLRFKDEDAKRLEGGILTQILSLSGKASEYRYLRTVREFKAVLKQFSASKRRYLHLSCHGGGDGLALTLEDLSYDDLGRLLRPHLDGRRLFISACSAVNDELAEALMRRNGCLSIVGPAVDVGFGEAAVMWAAFYHVMFKENPKAMKSASIESALQRLDGAFELPMTYIRRAPTKPYWTKVNVGSAALR